ncbi:MAG: extracellular solute-binding protein [Clostridia bacterium]|nr:extracellular solute-binding protein [Clostridia bacterium]
MKHTRITSLLALMLAVVMMLTLVGCGDKAEDSAKDTDSKKTTVTTTTTTTANNEGDGTTTGTEADGTTTGTEADGTTTGTEAPTTGAADPFGTQATAKPTKKPTTTTTTSKAIPTGTESIFKKVPEKLKGQKIKMMVWWDVGQSEKDEVAFFKEQTGITVAVETATMDKYQSTLSGKIMAGNPPQIAAIISEWYPQPITRGLMQPIKVTGWDYSNKEDDIYALGLMDQFSYKGEHYGIALKGSNMSTYEVMFFNKDILKANGVKEDPYQLWKKGQWNWDTCLQIALQCTDAKKEKYGLTNISQFFWMLSAGQDFVISDINGLQNNIKNPKLLDAWNHAWDMIYTHKVIPQNFSQQKELFYAEQVAMFGVGSYFMQAESSHNNYVPQNAKFDWGVVPFPSPAGMSPVAACEGTVWGFPTKVSGDKLQAAMWYLRYNLDDTHYGERDFYSKEECWEVMGWMSNQKVQSYNSVGVVCYGGKYNAWSIQYSVIDEATTKAAVKTNLDKWYAELDANIETIENEL